MDEKCTLKSFGQEDFWPENSHSVTAQPQNCLKRLVLHKNWKSWKSLKTVELTNGYYNPLP